MQFARDHLERHDAAAGAAVHVEGGGEPLFVNLDAGFENLVVERDEQRLAGNVADEIRSGLRGAAKRARAELPFLVAIKDDAHVLELDDVLGRLAAHHLDGVLVGEIIAALDRIEGMRLPAVGLADGSVDAPLGRAGMAANRMHFGDDGNIGAEACRLKGGAHPRKPGAHYDNVVIGNHEGVVSLKGAATFRTPVRCSCAFHGSAPE